MTLTLLALLTQLLQVDEPYQRFAAAYASLDAERVSRVYAEDALMLPTSGEVRRGRAVIRDHYAKGFATAFGARGAVPGEVPVDLASRLGRGVADSHGELQPRNQSLG